MQQQFLNNEKEVLKLLKNTYTQSQKDVEKKIAKLEFDINGLQQEYDWAADEDKAGIQSKIQAKIYQKQYQEALHGQIDTILDNLHTKAYKGVDDYLKHSYEDGFIGTMYDLHGQGIPLIMPIDQQAVTRAVQLDSKISKNLYTKMGENVQDLKKNIAAEVSRGIVNGASYADVAQQIKLKMTGTYNTNGGAMSRAMTIARTEGHRVQVQAGFDACYAAKDMGANVLKQWDSALDNRTRPTHRVVDGEIRELDKPFSNGLQCPGDSSGGAAEVVNCRCALLQRAKWALDEEELETLKKRAEYYGLDKTENFEDFKKKYLKAVEKENVNGLLTKNKKENGIISKTRRSLKQWKVEYKEVKPLKKELAESEIISRLSGGDETKGSCSSLAFAYIGNVHGLDVLDFRGGDSLEYFAKNGHIRQIMDDLPDVKGIAYKVKKEAAETAKILLSLEHGKKYYCAVGKHAAIIRNTENGVEYLELQSKSENGWISCKAKYGTAMKALVQRFGCRKTADRRFGKVWEKDVYLMEVDTFKNNEEFRKILGYLNTSSDKQRKGAKGGVK